MFSKGRRRRHAWAAILYACECNCRFPLLTRITVARNFSLLEGRRNLARLRLLSLHILFQCNPSAEAVAPPSGLTPASVIHDLLPASAPENTTPASASMVRIVCVRP